MNVQDITRHDGDTSGIIEKDPKVLIKRIIDSVEYDTAISGLGYYPMMSHRRFAQEILKEKSRKKN